MNTKTKKGFTLTELIIVVVIIGILAAVLIPTLTACVKKAKISNDKQLVRNLNLALSTDSLANHDGAKHENMTEALKAADDAGYNVTKINATKADNEILWDSKHDVFCYYNDGEIEYIPASIPTGEELNVRDHANLLWQIIDVEDENLVVNASKYKFSVYASGKASGVNSITTDKGFDAGEQSFTLINYVHEVADPGENYEYVVVIRTNSAATTLTINAALDTVKHYGSVGSLNIIAVANASYHEYGKAAFAEIATGRIVLESESEVEHIHLAATEGNFNDITVAKASDVEMPDFSRDPVEIPAEGKLVVALQDGTDKDDDKDYVWLTAVGIYEQVTVSESKTDAGHNYAANSNNEEKKEAAQQIANTITFSEGGEDYKVTAKTTDNGTTWTYEVVDNSGNVSEEYSAAKDTTKNTVNVQTTGDNPETVETAKENGLTEAAKEEKQTELVNEAIIPELADQYEEETTAVVYNLSAKVYYEDLYTAIAAVPNNTKQTLVLLKNVIGVSNKNYQIDDNQIIVFDLNGHTMNTVAPDDQTAYTILNNGTLTLKDSTDKKKDGTGNGKIEINALNPDLKGIPSYASNVITNNSVFVLESGFIDNGSMGLAAFGIDNSIGSSTTINGGRIIASMAQAIRVMVGSTAETTFAFHGGYIKSLWIQNYAQGDNSAKLDMLLDGGEVNIVSAEVKCSPSGYHSDISGADFHMHFDKNIKVTNKIELASYDETGYADADILISGGTFEGTILDTYSSYGNIGETKYVISGGTFKNEQDWSDTQYVYSKESGLDGMVGSFANAFSGYGVTDVNDSIIDEMMSDSHKEEYIFNETVKFAHFQTATNMLGKPCYRVYLLVDSFNASRVASGYHAVDNNDGTITVIKDAD